MLAGSVICVVQAYLTNFSIATQGKIEVGCEVCGNEKHKHGHHHHKSEEKHHKRHEHHKHHEDK